MDMSLYISITHNFYTPASLTNDTVSLIWDKVDNPVEMIIGLPVRTTLRIKASENFQKKQFYKQVLQGLQESRQQIHQRVS